jgi:hypothetical protein
MLQSKDGLGWCWLKFHWNILMVYFFKQHVLLPIRRA